MAPMIPKSYMNESIAVNPRPWCPLCCGAGVSIYVGLRDRLHGAPGLWGLMKCESCRCVWLDPTPLDAEIPRLYGPSYYTHGSEEPVTESTDRLRTRLKRAAFGAMLSTMGYANVSQKDIPDWMRRFALSSRFLREHVLYRIRWLEGPSRGRLLDVGCGAGDFLADMKTHGWDVVGIEPDRVAAENAIRSHNLEIHCSTLGRAGFSPASFDAITMSHVIEHLPDPVSTIKACGRLLRDGGRLVLITPNTASMARRIFGSSWYAWEVPRHLVLFDPLLLSSCVASAGLEVVHLRTGATMSRNIWKQSRLIRKYGVLDPEEPLGKGGAMQLESYVAWIFEHFLLKWKDLGEEIILVAKRPADTEGDYS